MLVTIHTDASVSLDGKVTLGWVVRELGGVIAEGSLEMKERMTAPCSARAEALAILAAALRIREILDGLPALRGRGCKVLFRCDNQTVVEGMRGQRTFKQEGLNLLRARVKEALGDLPHSFQWCRRRENDRADSLAGGRAPAIVKRRVLRYVSDGPPRKTAAAPLTASIKSRIASDSCVAKEENPTHG